MCVTGLCPGTRSWHASAIKTSFISGKQLAVLEGMKLGELTIEEIMDVKCPVCRAVPGVRCTMKDGSPRIISTAHRDRRVVAGELRFRRDLAVYRPVMPVPAAISWR
jgi:hypothetical protein